MKKVNFYDYIIYENGDIISPKGKKLSFNKTITLLINGKYKKFSYARVVYFSFHKELDFYNYSFCVKHKDNNIRNNNLNNLYITNKKENISGEKHKLHKLTDEEVREIRELYKIKQTQSNGIIKNFSYRKLADMYGVSHTTIRGIVKKEWRKQVKEEF